jgi:hypothetical protein
MDGMREDPASFFRQRATVCFHRRRKHSVNSEEWLACVREARRYVMLYRETALDMAAGIDEAEVIRRLYARLEKHLGRELPPPPEFWDAYPTLPLLMSFWKRDAA